MYIKDTEFWKSLIPACVIWAELAIDAGVSVGITGLAEAGKLHCSI